MNFFPEQIKKLREELGLNQTEMADLCNISRVNYSRYESGKNEPSLTFMYNMYKNVPNLNLAFIFDPKVDMWKKDSVKSIINEPSSEYVTQQLISFEAKTAALIDRIEKGPWSPEIKLKMVESMIRIVQKSLGQEDQE